MTLYGVSQIFGMAVALVAATAATAQWRTKSDEQDTRKIASDAAAREFVTYTRCVVVRRYDRARSVVLAPYASPEQAAAVGKVISSQEDRCLDGGLDQMRMKLGTEVLAGGLAQALVLKEYPDLPAVVARFKLDPVDENARLAKLNPAEAYGRCVVQRDPASALALFTSRPATAEERRAVAGLRDDLGPCLKAGSTLTINDMFLRNTTAIAAYRLAQQIAPRGRAATARSK